ncbi:MAG: aminotransferase class V-fold PLP-dependent enzyme [Phycisphaerales bacterium]
MTNHGDELIYLDHSATSWPKADGVGEAMASAVEAGNPGRGGHRAAREASSIVDSARAALASLLGEDDPRRVVFTSGCTDSVHTAIEGVVRACERREPDDRPEIVFSAIEHNAVARGVAALVEVGARHRSSCRWMQRRGSLLKRWRRRARRRRAWCACSTRAT